MIEEKITQKLQQLKPTFLKVSNNSHLHRGHLGDNGSGQTHFKIEITSEELKDLSKIAAHRKINKLLADEFNAGLHALEIKIIKQD